MEKDNTNDLLRLCQDLEFINFLDGMEYNCFVVTSSFFPDKIFINLN